MCETEEGIQERKPTKSFQCRLYNIIYVHEGIPEDPDKYVRRSSSPTVTDFWGVGDESLRVNLSVKEGSVCMFWHGVGFLP